MRVMVVGSGGREHALAWKLRQSPRVDEVVIAPGNGGIAVDPGAGCPMRCVPVVEGDVAALVDVARREQVDFTVVGPEVPIAAGVADAFEAAGLAVFAPSKRCALLESSKVFAKAFLTRNGISTAPFHVSTRFDDAVAVARMMPTPMVLKASGLAAGKGVSVVSSVREAEEVLRRLMVERHFKSAGDEVIIEQFLEGREVSLLAFVDEHSAVVMPLACDHKRLEDADRGPNTGGMGAYTPATWLEPAQRDAIMQKIFHPTIEALRRERLGYRGVLYFGIMVTDAGPWVLEFNVRFGDPETQVIVPALESDLLDLLEATAAGRLGEVTPRWTEDALCGVVVAARGYPGAHTSGLSFPALETEGVQVFHSGTALAPEGGLLTRGGRLATVVGRGVDLDAARAQAYRALARHDLTAFHYRRDIGAQASPARKG